MIDPKTLIDPTQAGMPAPVWFAQFFKALGFTLHMRADELLVRRAC